MAVNVIFDVDIRDVTRFRDFMAGTKPALEAAGGKYLARSARLVSVAGLG